jgi:hypothetical protein
MLVPYIIPTRTVWDHLDHALPRGLTHGYPRP